MRKLLLKELKNTKANSSAEILRLKKELATVRAVLRDYIRQVDSLQRVNQALIGERDEALAAAARTRVENTNIQAENTQLNEQVAIAAQLNATGVNISPLKKNGKSARKSKDVARFVSELYHYAKCDCNGRQPYRLCAFVEAQPAGGRSDRNVPI
ncbi:hypothetical protein EVA_04501 [gut metagenome]|uniref:Uncharacterized protein n=1 Tax=gut metagenome TaxID=749906 RepID=J9GWJ9_9ZZZZ